MRILDRYVFAEVLGPFLFGMAAFNALMFASDPLRKSVILFVEHDVALRDAVLMLVLRLPVIIAYSFPMAMLLGALLGVGRLSSENEAAAMLAGGMSFYRLILPVLLLGALVSGAAFAFNESLVPRANLAMRQLLVRLGQEEAKRPKATLVLREPQEGPLELLVVAQQFDDLAQRLTRPDVYVYRQGRPRFVISAAHALWDREQRRWEFQEPVGQSLGLRKMILSLSRCEEVVQGFTASPEEIKERQHEARPDQMRLPELRAYISSLRRHAERRLDRCAAELELHNRYAVPLSSFLFALVGAPLAVRPQRTTLSLAFGLTLFLIIIYYLIWTLAGIPGNQGRLNPALASWIANLVMFLIGVFILVRRAR